MKLAPCPYSGPIKPGDVFGSLTVIKVCDELTDCGNRQAECKCVCGNTVRIPTSNLMSGATKSCGCKRIKLHNADERNLAERYRGIIRRCYDTNHISYPFYGGRSTKPIRVCKSWREDRQKFIDWALKHGYSKELSIDRINPDGNYSLRNCRWTDMKTQQNNKTCNRIIVVDGISETGAMWGAHLGLTTSEFYDKIKRLDDKKTIDFIRRESATRQSQRNS